MGSCNSTASGVPLDSDIAVESPHDGSTRVLSEAKAWEIALAWIVPLQGHAWLFTDEARVSKSIVPSFEWVLFHFCGRVEGDYTPKARECFAANARAATIAWFALSCCEGYSGTENPPFWRRVFLEYRYPPPSNQQFQADKREHGRDLLLSESVRFFTTPGQPFPRVSMITAPEEHDVSVESIFLGRHIHVGKPRDAKLHHTLTTLKPFIRQRQWVRSIPVKIDHVPIAKVVDLLQMDASPPIQGPISSELHPQSTLPQRRLAAVGLKKVTTSRPTESSLGYHTVRSTSCAPKQCTTSSVGAGAGPALRRRASSKPSIFKRGGGFPVCTCICRDQNETLESCAPLCHTFALGYALFHPEAETQSGLTGISINIHSASSKLLTAMYYMSQSNNLLAAVRTDVGGASCVYVEGRVGATVNVWPQPREERPLQSRLRKDSWITLCVRSIAAFEEEESEWVFVVNPGFGFGWLQRSSIIELRERPPGRPRIHTLRIHAFKNVHEPKMVMLLNFFKRSQKVVRFVGGEAVPSSIVLKILQICSCLKTLCDSDAELKQLNARRLPHLRAVRVVAMNPESFSGHQDILMALLHEQQVVEYVHWTHERESYSKVLTTSYRKQHDAARSFLQVLRDEEIHVAHQPFQRRCLLAFLSVIARVAASNTPSKRSPIGFFGQDIVVLITQYTSSSVRREVTIE